MISLLLDPLELCPDGNRTNNREDYFIHIDSLKQPSRIIQPTCLVFSDFNTRGEFFIDSLAESIIKIKVICDLD
jgi:hypothetical protein